MPCPPSYEEMESMRMGHEVDSARERLAVEQATINEISQVLKEVKTYYKEGIPREWEELFKVLTQRDFSKSISSFHPSSLNDAELKRYSEHVNNSYSTLQYAEIHQCEQRTLLMNLWRRLPENTGLNEKLKEELERQKKLHLEHRLKDREQAVANLKKELSKSNGKKTKEIQKEINRILAIPGEELLYDRKLF